MRIISLALNSILTINFVKDALESPAGTLKYSDAGHMPSSERTNARQPFSRALLLYQISMP